MKWYGLSVLMRSEMTAAQELAARGTTVFAPTCSERRLWSDRVVTRDVPLFPGYVFVLTDMTSAERIKLLKTRAVRDVVGRVSGDVRVAREIPAAEIESLQRLVASRRALDPLQLLAVGQPVMIASGPLRGVHGIVERQPDGQRRLTVNVRLLGRSVRTLLRADDVLIDHASAPI